VKKEKVEEGCLDNATRLELFVTEIYGLEPAKLFFSDEILDSYSGPPKRILYITAYKC
jgi:hypothetical protein